MSKKIMATVMTLVLVLTSQVIAFADDQTNLDLTAEGKVSLLMKC